MPGSEWQPNPDQQRAIETLSGFCVVQTLPSNTCRPDPTFTVG